MEKVTHYFQSQVLYFKQDAGVLKLLKVMLGPSADPEGGFKFRVLEQGRTRRVTGTDIASVIRKISPTGFNQVIDRSITTFPHSWSVGVKINFLSSILDVSPNNVLWRSPIESRASSPESARSIATFQSLEEAVRYHGVTDMPSALVTYFEAASSVPKPVVLSHLHNHLSNMPLDDDFVAYIDFEKIRARQIPPHALARLPIGQMGTLASKIDSLHNVIVGASKLCEDIASALMCPVICKRLTGNPRLAWLQVPEDACDHWSELEAHVKPWMVE